MTVKRKTRKSNAPSPDYAISIRAQKLKEQISQIDKMKAWSKKYADDDKTHRNFVAWREEVASLLKELQQDGINDLSEYDEVIKKSDHVIRIWQKKINNDHKTVEPKREMMVNMKTSNSKKLNSCSANQKPLLGITGQYQRGKSTLLNCLLGGYYAVEGKGLTTTKYHARYRFGEFTEASIFSAGKTELLTTPHLLFDPGATLDDLDSETRFEVSAWSPLLKSIDIQDSPGYGANQVDDKTALHMLSEANFILYVVSQKTLDKEADLPFLQALNKENKRFSIVFNCLEDQAPDDDSALRICEEINGKIISEKLNKNYVAMSDEHPVYPVNLLWAQCALGYLDKEMQGKKLKKIKGYFDGELPSQRRLLSRSGFMVFRNRVAAYVKQFSKLEVSEPLLALERATQHWESAMIKIFEQAR